MKLIELNWEIFFSFCFVFFDERKFICCLDILSQSFVVLLSFENFIFVNNGKSCISCLLARHWITHNKKMWNCFVDFSTCLASFRFPLRFSLFHPERETFISHHQWPILLRGEKIMAENWRYTIVRNERCVWFNLLTHLRKQSNMLHT